MPARKRTQTTGQTIERTAIFRRMETMNEFKWKQVYFDLNSNHVALLKRANISWDGSAYAGAPGFDCKRPFGNGDIVSDIAGIIGIKPIETDDEDAWPKGTTDYCMNIYKELETALQVVLVSGSFKIGQYVSDEYHDNWKFND